MILPFSERGVELDIPVDMLASGDRLLDPAYDREPIALCRKLSQGEAKRAKLTLRDERFERRSRCHRRWGS